MSKTASIASSAGASFENTSAFLAQMIESTREAPDAIGTSVKTIVARFNELKKAPEDIGEIDGEIVDANAIETALRSIGISLRDTEGQFRNFDEIIYELAEKWDGLSRNQQRYIATVAAGSRQQSRFIALLSDYDRLMELTNAANNAAGASNMQYEKTLDSLESKLAKLDNAWTTFTTTIVNSNLYKGAIDLLGGIVNAINNITSALDGNSGIAKIALLFGALKTGDVAIKGFTESWRQGGSVLESVGAGFKKVGDSAKNAVNKVKEMKQSLKDAVSEAKASATAYQTLMKKAPGLKKQKQEGTKKYKRAQEMFKEAETDDGYVFAQNLESEGIDQEISAQAELNKLQNDWVKALNLTDDQRKISLALQQKATDLNNTELGTNQALILAKYDLIAADKIQDLTQDELNKKTQIANMLLEAQTMGGAKGLIAKYALIAADKLQEKTSEKNIIVKLLDNVATQALTGSTWALVGSILALIAPVLLVVAAFIALVAIFKEVQANSPAALYKEASENAERLKNEATEAATAVNDLTEAFENLNEKYENLENLTQGTKEWKNSVKDVNKEVMNLIDAYPDLVGAARYVDGVWQIDEAVQESAIQKAQEREDRLNIASTAANMYVSELQNANDLQASRWGLNDFDRFWLSVRTTNSDSSGWWSYITAPLLSPTFGSNYVGRAVDEALSSLGYSGEFSAERLMSGIEFTNQHVNAKAMRNSYADTMAELYSRNGITEDSEGNLSLTEEGEEYVKQIGLTTNQFKVMAFALQDNIEEVKSLGEAYAQNRNETEQYNKYLHQQAKQQIDTTYMVSGQKEIIDDMDVELLSEKASSDAADKIKTEYGEGKQRDNVKILAAVKKQYGVTQAKIEGENIIYGEDDTTVSIEQFLKELTVVESADNLTSSLETLSNIILTTAKDYKNIFKKTDGGALTTKDLNEIKNGNLTKEQAWEQLGSEGQALYESQEAFDDWWDKTVSFAEAKLETANEKIAKAIGDESFKLAENISADAAKGYATKLSDMGFQDSQIANEFNTLVGSFANFMNDDDYNTFVSQLSSISDWSNRGEWENFGNTLEELGLKIPTDRMNEFINRAIELNNAIYKTSFKQLIETYSELAILSEELRSKARDRSGFTEEEYEKITKNNSELLGSFVKNLDGSFTYLGGSIMDLADAIDKLTEVELDQKIETTNTQIAIGEAISGLTEKEQFALSRAAQGSTDGNDGQIISNFIRGLTKEIDFTQLGISGLTNDNVMGWVRDEEKSKQLFSTLWGYYTDLSSLNQELENLAVLRRQKENATFNTGIGDKNQRDALMAQAVQSGVSENYIQQYAKASEVYEDFLQKEKKGIALTQDERKAYNAAKTVLEEYNDKLAQHNNLIERNEKLQQQLEDYDVLIEDYENTTAAASKSVIANQLAGKIGITFEPANEQEFIAMVQTMISGSQESYEAYLELVAAMAEQKGIDVVKLLSTKWTEEMLDQEKQYKEFIEALGGLGGFTDDESGVYKLLTSEDLLDMTEKAGLVDSWESAYDWIYNYTQQSEALVREREKAERTYLRLLESEQYTAEEVLKTSNAQVDALKRQSIVESEAAKKAQTEIKDLFSNSKYSNYVAYNQNTGAVIADYPRLDKITDEEFGEDFDEFISELEELRDTYQDAVDNLEDIEDDLKAIAKERKDAYSTLIDQVQEALIQSYQDIIDERSSVSEAIKDAQDTIVNSMQEQIDATRQARENDKTTSDLEDRRLRLAALMRDTSGGNAVEIAKLQKELTEAEENYTDTLVDQALERLQDANEKAAEQRDKQIELAQAQLDAYSESSVSFDDAEAMLTQALNDASLGTNFATAFEASSVGDLLKNQAEAMNKVAWSEWTNELSTDAANAWAYLSGDESLQTDIKAVQAKISDATSKLEGINTFLGDGSLAAQVKIGEENAFKLEGGVGDKIDNVSSSISDLAAALREAMEKGYIAPPYEAPPEAPPEESQHGSVGDEFEDNDSNYYSSSNNRHGSKDHYNRRHYVYATGGLADFTGPAWLDGTPTRPEMVLNPQDTANFIVLKDILSDILVGASSTASATKSGDNYYDIAINVDSISDDYDVEQMADKVRDMIYQDSIYRNVNTVNRVK